MLIRILRHEWRMLTRDSTLAIVTGVLAVALASGLANGMRWRTSQESAIDDALREERIRLQTAEAAMISNREQHARVPPFSDPANPDTAGRNMAARYAVMPPAPLGELAVGQSDLLPSVYKVTTESKHTVLATSDTENPTRLLTGRFDVAFVVMYLYPLLILALTYNVLSQEQEQGTLALVLSHPVGLGRVMAVKIGMRLALVAGFIVAFALATALAVGVPLGDAGAVQRFGLWVATVSLYGGFWFALAMMVASRGFGSAMNAMLLSALWLALTVVLPSASNLVATTMYPVPSRVEMVQAIREASDEANASGAALLGQYYQDHPEFAADQSGQTTTDFNLVKLAVDEQIEASVRPVAERYDVQLASQQRLMDRLRFLSPAMLIQGVLNDISGSGVSRHRHFVEQVAAYHEAWRSHFFPLIARKATVATYTALPSFAYVEEPLRDVVQRTAASLLVLLGAAAALATVGFATLRRFTVVGR